ncbi:MAG TPA: GTP-binding protein, partial [Thiothrix sp.]|nr:GTP-binding protein [Thiothrix sp.]
MRKFIFTGPVGAGKTTAIQALTEDGILDTDVKTSDATGLRKETTTVAMDFAVVQLSNKELVHVYGTPGQERFDF